MLVRVHRSAWVNRTSGEGSAFGDFGHHCSGASWTEDPPAVVVYDWSWGSSSSDSASSASGSTSQAGPSSPAPVGGEVWPASGLLLATYDRADQGASFMRVGAGPTVHPFDAGSGTFGVRSAFEGTRTVANLTADDGALAVDGEPLRSGTPTTLDRWYSFDSGQSSFEAHERLAFTLIGPAEVTEENRGHPCI